MISEMTYYVELDIDSTRSLFSSGLQLSDFMTVNEYCHRMAWVNCFLYLALLLARLCIV